MTKFSISLRIPTDHPVLAGHFPGDPVVPGTMILDAVLEAVSSMLPGHRLASVRRAKFLLPLRPGQDAKIEIHERGGLIRFRCLRSADILALGEISVIAGD
jgi:3-hydroxymyristoyl/3-hydroxydecanoyl-(acyl carrier protein) dehydratase